jgi:hypothetical protein
MAVQLFMALQAELAARARLTPLTSLVIRRVALADTPPDTALCRHLLIAISAS